MSFVYTSANKTSNVRCNLDVKQCTALNKTTRERCGRMTAKQLPYCTQHSHLQLGVEIKKSTIPNAGFGLFALKDFKRKEEIVSYPGRKINAYQVKQMYGNERNDLAPYTVKTSRNSFVDSACARGIGSFSNNKPHQNNSELVSRTADKVTLKATKKIKKKSEIFTAYGPTYFKRPNSDPKPVFATSKSKIKHETPLVSPKGCMAPPGSEKVPPKKRKRK